MAFNINEYIEVKDRIVKFYEDHPDGRVQTEIVELTEKRVTVKALVYQDKEDARPTTGHSWLNIPGTTNFTRGSELENAETSAVGRALALSGYEVKKSIASRDEVEMKQDDGPADALPSLDKVINKNQLGLLRARTQASNKTGDEAYAYCVDQFAVEPDSLTGQQLDTMLAWLES
jgi:hypothetical protein